MKKLILLPGGFLAFVLVVLVLLMQQNDRSMDGGIEALAEKKAASSSGGGVHGRVISKQDLPPEGSRSLFDHLVREQGGLPFPFEKMLEMFASYDREGRWPNTLLIPDGRSLLKGHATFDAPRMVVAADAVPPAGAALMPILRGRLFLGFVEPANEIEVISYNESAGRFEFQLIENYCVGCVPRIVYAKRSICTTCHAGGGPIFPVRPWQETNVQPAIAQTLARHLQTEAYHGAPIARRLDQAQAFDDLTDVGNVIPATQKIWLDGCGSDGDACRRAMLKLALRYVINPAALDRETEASRELIRLQQINWPEQGIPLNNGNLNNRDPFNQALYDESFGAQLRNLFWPRADGVRSGDKLKDFDALPRLPAEFDPLSRRAPLKIIQAHELDGVYGLAQLFSADDIERLERHAGYDEMRFAQAIDALPDPLFAAVPVSRVQIMQALLQVLDAPAVEYCCLDVSDLSPPVVQGEPPLELASDSVLQPYEKYCFACHRGNPAARLDFMSGGDEATVLAKIKAQEKIREALDYERYLGSSKQAQLMPPEDSWQREALERAQARGEDPLGAMRDQVPSLFEF